MLIVCYRNRAIAKSLWQPTPDDTYNDVNDSDPDHGTITSDTPPPPTLIPVHSFSNSTSTAPTHPATSNDGGNTTFTTWPTPTLAHWSMLSDPASEDAEDDFVLHSARGHLTHIRRSLLVLEEDWGPVDRWPASFRQEWSCIMTNGAQQVVSWFNAIRHQVHSGRRIIRNLARVMDGEMPTVDEWRGLWLESYQLLGLVYTGVLGLELSLDLAERWYSTSHPENNLEGQLIA